MLAGFLIGGLGYASTFDLLAAMSVAVAIGFVLLAREPGKRRS
jgi:hypothetical protein